jgi:hypothetical protein
MAQTSGGGFNSQVGQDCSIVKQDDEGSQGFGKKITVGRAQRTTCAGLAPGRASGEAMFDQPQGESGGKTVGGGFINRGAKRQRKMPAGGGPARAAATGLMFVEIDKLSEWRGSRRWYVLVVVVVAGGRRRRWWCFRVDKEAVVGGRRKDATRPQMRESPGGLGKVRESPTHRRTRSGVKSRVVSCRWPVWA